MKTRPKCVIVTGRPGSGKTTLAKALAGQLWMPLVSRDAIKEGYVNTFGVKHDQLPPEANGVATDLFFQIVMQHLAGKVSVVIEAAFQHKLWEARMPQIQELSEPFILVCSIDEMVAAQRHLERGLADPQREFFHDDKRVAIYRETGVLSPPGEYSPPDFQLTTVEVSTTAEYVPSISDIVRMIEGMDAPLRSA